MGLLNKIKGILFEEVEEDEVVNTPKAEEKKPIAEKIEPQKKVEEVETPKVNVVKPKAEVEQLNERELFKSDNNSECIKNLISCSILLSFINEYFFTSISSFIVTKSV